MSYDKSAAAQRFRANMVRRAIAQRVPLLALPLSRYAQAEELTWQRLAASIGCSEDDLNRIALCSPPRQSHFVDDVQAIAESRADFDRLLPLLRRLQILDAWSAERAAEERAAYQTETPTAEQMLLAARDREEAQENADGEGDHD